jgi:hypothetical protein
MSNHLGDTNKMVSDTPRMDASAYDDGAIWETGCDIERELNRACEMYRKLDIHTLNLVDRIRRLEEAGDAMEKYIFDQTNTRFIICAIQWRKAKEAKL